MTTYIRKQELKHASEYACMEYIGALSNYQSAEGRPCDYNNYGNHKGFDRNGTAIRPYNTYEEGLMWYRATQPQLEDWMISQIVYENIKRTQHPDIENAVVKNNEFAGLDNNGIRLKKRRDRLQKKLDDRNRAKTGLTRKTAPIDEPFVLEFDTGFATDNNNDIDKLMNFIELN